MKKAKIQQIKIPENLTIEEQTYLCIGRLTVAYSVLEGNINLAICCASWPDDREITHKKLNKMQFSSKVAYLNKWVSNRSDLTPELKAAFQEWVTEADQHRAIRNSFIHGRWGFDDTEKKAFHIEPSVYGQTELKQMIFTIEDLIKEIRTSDILLLKLNQIRPKLGL